MLSIIMTYQEMIAAHQDYVRQQILHRYSLSVRSEDTGFRGMQSFDGPVAGVWGADPRGPPDLRKRNADARASTHLRAFFRDILRSFRCYQAIHSGLGASSALP